MKLAATVAIGAALGQPLGPPASVVTVVQADAHCAPLDPSSAAISGDGRYVAFTSYAQLVREDTDHQRDVYLLDRSSGTVTLASSRRDNFMTPEDAEHPSISLDGQTLVYALVDKIILYDRQRSTNQIVAKGREPVISADARLVVFTSPEINTESWGTHSGNLENVYLYNVTTKDLRLVSVDANGRKTSTGWSIAPSVTADGRYVAFSSTAPLIQGVKKQSHVFVRDMESGTTKVIAPGWRPAIDQAGRYLAFVSPAGNLTSGDRNHTSDVFVADLRTGAIELVTRSIRGGTANGTSANPAISGDGRFIVFQSDASDLVCRGACVGSDEDINLLWDVFVFDRVSGAMKRLSEDPASGWMEASIRPAIDGTGAVIAFSSSHPIDSSDKAHDFDLFIRQSVDR
jgi:Tol biopolymer transport system component